MPGCSYAAGFHNACIIKKDMQGVVNFALPIQTCPDVCNVCSEISPNIEMSAEIHFYLMRSHLLFRCRLEVPLVGRLVAACTPPMAVALEGFV